MNEYLCVTAIVWQRLRGFQQFRLPGREGGCRPQLRPRLLHEGEQVLPQGHQHQVVSRILVSGTSLNILIQQSGPTEFYSGN